MMKSGNHLKWVYCTGLALTLMVLAVFLTPRRWISWLPQTHPVQPVALERANNWLWLAPPVDIEVADQPLRPRRTPPRPVENDPGYQDPAWWRRGVRVRIEAEGALGIPDHRHQAEQDSIGVLWRLLALPQDLLMRSRPDSLLAARLWALHVSEGFNFDAWKPYLAAMGRAEAYADILSRAADMYNEFLGRKIMAPDIPQAPEHSP